MILLWRNAVHYNRVGTSGKIVWKLRNVWKSLESLEIVWNFECFRSFVWKMSGNDSVFPFQGSCRLESQEFLKHFGKRQGIFFQIYKNCSEVLLRCVACYTFKWHTHFYFSYCLSSVFSCLLNNFCIACLMVSVVWKIILLWTSLSGKKHVFFKLRFWKNSINSKVLSGNLIV